MYKLFSIFSISSLLQGHAFSQSILVFMNEILRAFKAVNRRALSTIGTTLMLSALLSACGGGGGGGGSDAPAPVAPISPTTPTFSVSSSNFSVDEDFATPQLVASVSNATTITVSQSNTGVVTVTTSNAQVNVSSIANANGRTILTIRATNGAFSATTQVTVTVNAVNDPPTLAVSSSNISTVGGFSPITINTTASDIEDGALAFTVSESTIGVVRVGTSADAIILSNMPNVSGQTTLTITVVDSSGSTVTQTIAVNVTITTSTSIPALSVSSMLVNEQEDFGIAVVIRTTATDADGDTITLSVSPLRGIVNADIATSVISTNTIVNTITLSAVANTNGTATLTVLAADVGGQSTEVNIVVVVAAVNDAPTLTIPTLDLVLAEDFVGARTVISAVDVDSNTLIVTVVESTTGVVTVTTSASSVQVASIADINGKTTLSITISDGILSSTAQLVVTVTAVNDSPVLTVSTTALTLDEDFAQVSIDATRSDVDGDTLTLTVSESTTGIVTVTTSVSGIQVTNIANANGQTTLTITLSDGTTSTSTQVVVIVNAVNDAPVLTISTTALTLDEDFATAVVIVTTRSDVEGDTLTLTVSESTTGVVNVTATDVGVRVANIANANGQTTLTITLSDGTTNTSVQVAVSVTAVNDPPTLTVSTNSLSTLGGFTPITINTTASDVEDASLTFTVAESTTGVVRVTQSANAIVLNTIAGASGQTILTVSLVDSSGTTVTQTIDVSVTVTAGAAPVLMVSTNRINVQEDFGSVVIRTTASDSDSTTLTLTVTPSMRLVNVEISTRTNNLSSITLTAIANLNGTATLTFRATDDGGQTNSTEIVVVVAAVNDTPTLTVPTTTLTVLEDFDDVRSVATLADVDSGDFLTVTVTESNARLVTVTTSASGVSVAAIANMNGRTTLNISVSDGTLSSTAQVVVDVTPVNDPPVLTVSTSALTLAEDFATAVAIGATRNDVDGDTLTLTVAESTTGVVTVTTSASGVSVAAINNANGTTTLTITLSDGTTSTSTQVPVTVTAVNDPPTLGVLPNALTLNEDFATPEVITVTRTDIDGDTLTLTVVESATGVVTVTTTASGVQVASILNANGQTTLTITVNDGTVDTTAQVAVSVTAVNDAPSLNISTTNVVVDEDFANAVAIATAADVENNTLTISIAESTTGVVTVTTSASSVSVSSILNANGQTTLTITVNDGTSDTTAQVVVTVTAVNDTPTLTVSNSNITAVVDFSTITINTTANDIEDGILAFTVSESTAGVVTVTTSTNAITLNAVAGSTGQTSIMVRTTDSAGLSAMQTIAVNVLDATTPTLMVSTNRVNVQEDFGSVVIQTTATDSNGVSIALSVNSSSNIVNVVASTPLNSISTITNRITLTAVANANGTSILTVQAASAGGQTISTEIVVVVASVNDTPTLTIPNANLVLAEDFSGNSTIATAIDIDGDTLTFSVVESITGLVTVSTSASGVSISNRPHANGVTTLTITVRDGSLSSTAQVVVTVTEVNDPPILNIPNATLTRVEDFVGGITVATASDVDGNPLTFSVDQSTTGVIRVTVSTSDVRISSRGDANGITTLSISVSDGRIVSSTAQVVVTVTPVNDPPVLTVSVNALTLDEDFGAVMVGTTRTDIDSNPLTLTVAESTTGVITVQTSTSGISVSSIDDRSGRTTLTITLSDSELSSTTQVVVDVAAVNDTPTLTVSTTALTLNEDFGSVLIATTRSDVDSNTLTLTVAESATGVVTVLTSTSGISVSSIENKNGRTTLTITLSDSQLISTAQVVVDVTPVNDAPTFVIPSATLTVAEDFASTLTIATASDVEGDTLTITVSESTTGIVKVTTSATGAQIVSLRDVSGQTTLMMTVSDSTLSSTTQVVVTVTAVNDPPVLSVTTPAFTLNEDFAPFVILVNRTDVDSNTLTLTLAESATGVVTVTPTTLGFDVNSISGVNGITTLTITLSDGDLSTTTQVVVDVAPINDPPSLTVSTTALILAEDFGTVLIATTRTDIDSNTLTLTVAESTTGVVTVQTSTSGVSVSSIENINGITTLTITLSDGRLSTTTQVVVEVTAVNDPPVLTVTMNALTLLEDFGVVLIGTNRSDEDSNTLTLTVSESTTGVVTVQTTTSGVSVSSIDHRSGRTTLTITLSDNLLNSTAQVVVDVTAVNDPPVLTVSTNALTLAEDFGVVLIGTNRSDVDSNTLTLTVSESTTGVVTVQTTTSGVSVSSIDHRSGRTTLTITLSDSLLNSTAQVVVDVTAVNDPPVLTVSTNALTLAEDFATVLIATTRTDIDSNTLTLTVSESTTGLVTVTTTDAGISVSSILNANGQTILIITLSDGDLITTTQVVVDVTPINDPPVISVTTSAFTLNEDFATFVIPVNRTDVDSTTLTLTVAESTTGLVTVTTTTLGIEVNSISGVNGRTTLTINLSDGRFSTTTQVVVDVTPVNDPPVLTVSTNALTLLEDFATILIATTRMDIDSTTLTLTVAESNAGVVSVTATDVGVRVANIANANGRTTLTITLSDGRLSTTTQVVVDVTAVNDPPVLTASTTALTLAEDFGTVLIATTRMDIDSTTLTLTVAESNAGVVSVTATDVGVRVANIANANGRTTLTITLSDGRLSTTTQVVVDVTAVNDPPVLTVSTTALTLAEDFGTVLIATTRTDVDSTTLTLTVAESTTGVVSVTATDVGVRVANIANANGRTTLTITLSDGRLSTTTQVVVDVTAVNDPPVLTVSTTALTLAEDFGTVLIATTRMDIDSNALTLTVSESTTGVISVTTTDAGISVSSILNANGQTTLTITLSDGRLSTTTQVVVDVTAVNDPPVISVTTPAFTLNEDFATFVILVNRTDVDSTTLTLTVAESNAGVVTVTTTTLGIEVNSISGVNGRTTLTISLSDGGLSSTAQVVVDVTPINDPPVLTVSTTALTLVEDFATPILIGTTRTDIDGDTLTLTVAESTTGLVTVTTTDAGVRVANIANANGRTTLTITLSDGRLSTTTQVVVDVTAVNDPPVLTVSTNTLTLLEDFGTILIATTRTDVDSTTLTLTVSESNAGVVSVTATDVGVRVANIANANGRTTLTITLSDGRLSTTTQVVVDVTPINDPPVISVTTPAFTLNEDFATFVILVNRTDVDSTTLTLTVAESNAGVITVTTTTLGIEVNSISGVNGRTTLTISLSDGRLSTTTQVVVDVTPINDPPVLTVSTNALTLLEDFGMVLIATTRTDIDGDTLTLTVAESTTGLVTVTTTDAGVRVANIANANGRTTLTITLSDGRLSTTTQVVVDVTAVNDPPVLTVSTNTLTLLEDFGTILIATTRTDVDSTTLTLTVSESNAGVISVTATDVGVRVANIANANGRTTLTITLSDGRLSTTAQVVVDVTPINDPPVLTVSTTALTLAEDFGMVLIAATRTDIDSNTLTLTVAESNAGVITVTTTTLGIEVNSISGVNGRTTLTISLSDGGLSSTAQVVVDVTPINDPPVLTVSTTALTLVEDFATPILIGTTRTDIDGDTLTLTVSESTTGLVTVTTTDAGVSVSSILNANGQTTLTITLSDGGLSSTAQVVVDVTPINDPPVLTVSTNALTLLEDFGMVLIATTRTDIDSNTLTLTVAESNAGVVTVTTTTSGIAVNSISGVNGRTTLTISLSDGRLSTTTQVVVDVTPINDPPVLTVSTNALTLLEDFGMVLIATTRTDIDSNTLTLTVAESNAGVITVTTTDAGVSVSSILNANGQTTLTITLSDGGLSSTAQVVVDVTSVNDPPTLTVTSNAVTVGLDPVVLTVSAFDLEDSTLSFSVSTGQGVVNTAITTTSLTLTRLGLNVSQIMLTLRTTDTANVSVSTVVTVALSPALLVTTSIKTLNFAWSAITSSTHYQLQSNPDGTSGFTDLSTTGIVVSPNSTNIRQTTAQALVALHWYIPNVRNPQYSVETCNTASSCGPSFRHNTVSLTNAQLNSMIGRLQASNAEGGDSFGSSVSLSGDGNTLAVGATDEAGSSTGVNGAQDDNTVSDSGAVYVFRRIGGAWSQQAYIKASNTGADDQFGFSVSLNGDGNTLAVGASREDSSSTGVNGSQDNNTASDSGAVYVFRRIGGAWSQQAYIKASNTGTADQFGFSVSLNGDGNTLAVGAGFEEGSSTGVNGAQDDNTAPNSGAVYLFRFNTTSSIWSQQAYIKASNTKASSTGLNDYFGFSVSLNGDGNTLAVGAIFEDSSSTGVNGAQDDNTAFGSGAVYVFRFNTISSIWSQQAYIKASNTGRNDYFGSSVSLNGDGDTLAVGAMFEDSSSTGVNNGAQNNNSTNTGAVYLFHFSTGTGSSIWSEQAYIKASNTGGEFGKSVSLSADGNILAVGATGEDGSATGVGGVDDNSTDNAGATYVFEFGNGTWAQQAYIKATDPSVNASFGSSVSLSSSGNTLAVGANGVSSLAGAVYLY